MKRENFIRSEAARIRRFMDKYAMDDFDTGFASYSCEYRCGCGFRCDYAGDIYDHAESCNVSSEPTP